MWAPFVDKWKSIADECESDKLDILQLEPDVVVQITVAELLDLYHKGLSHGAGEYQKDVTVRGEII